MKYVHCLIIMAAELKPPEEFPFPFQPYAIQKNFMRELYHTLERGQVGIFESPTGTVREGWEVPASTAMHACPPPPSQGKSLSIICGALKWLVDKEEQEGERLDAVLSGRLPASALHGPLSAPPATGQYPPSTAGQKREEPDWFAAYDRKKAEQEALQRLKEDLERRKRQEAKLKKLREEFGSEKWKRKRKVGYGVLWFTGVQSLLP